MRTLAMLVSMGCVVAASACGGGLEPMAPDTPLDGGVVDGAVDSAPKPGDVVVEPHDEGGDAGLDAASLDAGIDAAAEAGVKDAGVDAASDAGPLPDAAPDVQIPPTNPGVPVGTACLRTPALTPTTQTHVIGVYESSTGGSGSSAPGTIDVRVTPAASPATLYLSSHDAVIWRVALDPGASVAKVFLRTYYPAQTVVQGLAGSVPVTSVPVAGSGCSITGWEAIHSDSSCRFGESIAKVRSVIGGLETSFQGTYGGDSFTVPPPANAPHSHYDNTKPCADACSLPAGTLAWEIISPGTTGSVSGLDATVTTSTWGASLRGTRGARCGRHYFEVAASGGKATVTVMIKGIGFYPLQYLVPTYVVNNGRVGVALDLDDGSIRFVTAAGVSAPQAIGLWDHEEVVPAVDLAANTGATLELVKRAPFAYTPPASFAADL